MTTYPHRIHVHRPHLNLSLVAIVGLAAALIGLGSWVLVDRYAGGGGATPDATRLLDNFNTALNAGDATALAGLLAPNVEARSLGDTMVGAQPIANGLAKAHSDAGLHVERIAPVTVEGEFATTFQRYTEAAGSGLMQSTFQIKDGRILRFWSFQPGATPPFENAVVSSF